MTLLGYLRPLLLLVTLASWSAPVNAQEYSFSDGSDLTVEGMGWPEGTTGWTRLPDDAREKVRDAVWNLSRHSAGITIRFVTDSPEIGVEWTLTSDTLDLPHMPSTGVSGVDLYVRTGDGWKWANALRAIARTNKAMLLRGLEPVEREYMLHLPLYNGVEAIRIGVLPGYEIRRGPERPPGKRLPIVFYGTSITHGACASRTGSCHVAILGRRLDRPVLNLGFSGNGRMEMELADLLADIDAAVYVIDCLPNLNGPLVTERAVPFIERLRSLRPDTPILLVEDRTYGDAWINDARATRTRENRAALKEAFKQLRANGVEGISYLDGDLLLGDETEATVDGSHPNDLGFHRQANAMEPAIRELLDSSKPLSR